MNGQQTKKGIKNILYGIVSELLILVFGFVVPRIVIVSYGSEINGLLSSTTQLLTYLSLFEAGISSVMCNALYGPLASKDKKSISGIFVAGEKYYRRVSVYYGLGLILSSVIFAFAIQSQISKTVIFLVVLLSGLSSILSFQFLASIKNVISSDGNYYFISVLNLVIRLLNYGVTIVAALVSLNIVWIKVLTLAVTCIQIFVYRIYFRKKYGWINRTEPPQLEQFKQRKFYIVHQIASLLFSCTDIMLLTFFSSLTVVSIYTVYNNVISAIAILMNTIMSSFLFALGQTLAEDIQKYIKLHDAFKLAYMEVNFILVTVIYILFIPFIEIYMGNVDVQYADSMLALLFCLISLLNSARRIDNNLASISWNMKQTMPHVIIEAGINLSVSLALIIPLKIYGVLLGTIAAILYRVIVSPYYSEKYILHRRIIHGYKHALLNFSIFAVVVLMMQKITFTISNYYQLIGYGLVVGVIVMTVYVVLNGVFFKNEYRYILGHFIKKKR